MANLIITNNAKSLVVKESSDSITASSQSGSLSPFPVSMFFFIVGCVSAYLIVVLSIEKMRDPNWIGWISALFWLSMISISGIALLDGFFRYVYLFLKRTKGFKFDKVNRKIKSLNWRHTDFDKVQQVILHRLNCLDKASQISTLNWLSVLLKDGSILHLGQHDDSHNAREIADYIAKIIGVDVREIGSSNV